MPHKEAAAPGEKIVFDGVTYSVSAQQVGQYYHASWLCMECQVRGNSNQECDSSEEAVDRAQQGLRFHHASSHKRPLS
jgi:hypothetical protein